MSFSNLILSDQRKGDWWWLDWRLRPNKTQPGCLFCKLCVWLWLNFYKWSTLSIQLHQVIPVIPQCQLHHYCTALSLSVFLKKLLEMCLRVEMEEANAITMGFCLGVLVVFFTASKSCSNQSVTQSMIAYIFSIYTYYYRECRISLFPLTFQQCHKSRNPMKF